MLPPLPVPNLPAMIRQLLDRRVPQFVLLYLAGGWGFLEFLDWAVTRYVLSPALIDFVVALLLLFLPTVFVIAWRHGATGADPWRRIDGVAIGANVLVALVVLFTVFRNVELGAATTVKLVEDTEGNTVERVVPKAGFRRSVLIYDFENASGDTELDWLEFGLSLALEYDLAQDLFVTSLTSTDRGVREFLAERGVQSDEDVPLPLKRDAARRRGLGHFLAGSIRRGVDSLSVETRLYRTDTGRLEASREYGMVDAREVVDRISVDLRRDLGIPDGQIERSVDLPAAELLTDTPEAFRLIARAYEGLIRGDDPAVTARLADQALALDSTSAVAHIVAAGAALFVGDQVRAAAAVQRALRYAYRLPERVRLTLQVQNEFLFEGDVQAAMTAGRYWTEVYPEDVEARRVLAGIYAGAGDTEGQIGQLRALLAIDSTDVIAMRQMAGALTAEARYDSALAWYDRMRDRQPDDIDIRLDMARALESAGRFDAARTELEEAAVVDARDPEVPRQLALLDLRTGDFTAAAARLEQVTALERTPTERGSRIGVEESLYYQRGQFERLEDAYRRRLAALTEDQPFLNAVGQIANSEYLLFAAEAARGSEALAQIDSLMALLQAPWRYVLDFPALRNHLTMGDPEAARQALGGFQSYLDGISDLQRAISAWAEGAIATLEDGDCRRALALYDEAVEIQPQGGLFRVSRLECLTEFERWRDAEADAEWVVKHYPGRPTYRLALARYEAARGRTAEALAHLDFALGAWAGADPGYLPAREARALRERLGG